MKAYVQANGNIAGGKKVEFIIRDDGSSPDNARRLAQELITRDKVAILAGFGNTPTALAVAQLSAQAKVPQVIMVAATSTILDRSPYTVRTAQTIPQIASVIREWSAKKGVKTFVSVVSDYGPGQDAELWFGKTLEQNGGKVLEKLRVPLANPEFAPFLQRAADQKPDALFVFVPTGAGAALMKQFAERVLDKSGIRVIAISDVMDDELLNSIGDPALGTITGGPYSAAHRSPENDAFRQLFDKIYNGRVPT